MSRLAPFCRYDEDVSWMAAYLVPWLPFLIYSLSGDQAATHKTLSDKGREAQAYLQFILDYYDCLPQVGDCLSLGICPSDILDTSDCFDSRPAPFWAES